MQNLHFASSKQSIINLKDLRIDSPCDNLFQTTIDIQDTLLILNGAPHLILFKNPFDGQDSLCFLLTRNSKPYSQ